MEIQAVHPAWFVALSVAIAFLPALIGVATCYLKVNIVLTMLRSGLGAGQAPGNLVIMVISLALTAFIMRPVAEAIFERAEQADLSLMTTKIAGKTISEVLGIMDPLRQFMLKHSGQQELHVLAELQSQSAANISLARSQTIDAASTEISPDLYSDPALSVVVTAFVLSELKEAFAMAFVVLLPFLVVDLIVANVLVGMGMFMVSPVMVSLPLKVILFVLADGWLLLSKGLYLSYGL